MVFKASIPGCHLPSTSLEPLSSHASHDFKYMSSSLLPRLLSSSFAVFFYDCFCSGTFAELAPHRWFGLWHILIAMNLWVQLLGCNELHNACAIHCTNKKIFLRPRMPWEPDKRKELHLTEPPQTSMCLSWGTCPYSDGWWPVGSRPSNHPVTLRRIYFCCYLVHFILIWFVFWSSQSGHFMSTLTSGSNSCFL